MGCSVCAPPSIRPFFAVACSCESCSSPCSSPCRPSVSRRACRVRWAVRGTAEKQSWRVCDVVPCTRMFAYRCSAGVNPRLHRLLVFNSDLIQCTAVVVVCQLRLLLLLLCEPDKVIYQDQLGAFAVNMPLAAPNCELMMAEARQKGRERGEVAPFGLHCKRCRCIFWSLWALPVHLPLPRHRWAWHVVEVRKMNVRDVGGRVRASRIAFRVCVVCFVYVSECARARICVSESCVCYHCACTHGDVQVACARACVRWRVWRKALEHCNQDNTV